MLVNINVQHLIIGDSGGCNVAHGENVNYSIKINVPYVMSGAGQLC